MKIVTDSLPVKSKGNSEIIDLTAGAGERLNRSNLKDGVITFFVPGSTAAITIIEFEPGLRRDLPEALEIIAPSGSRYHHDDTWGDGNGSAHVRAAFLGPSLTVPFRDGRLLLGTWQQVVLVDCDNRPRQREILLQMMDE
jgi:secondary thiamine-phosphate synthase enzyme